jgi:hypothetical protein
VVITYNSAVQLYNGGTVTNMGTTWTHTFAAPGTLSPI